MSATDDHIAYHDFAVQRQDSRPTTPCPPTSNGSNTFILDVPPQSPEAFGISLLTSLNELDNLLDRATSPPSSPGKTRCNHLTAAQLIIATEELAELRTDAMELYDAVQSEITAIKEIMQERKKALDSAASSEVIVGWNIERTEAMYKKQGWHDLIERNKEVNDKLTKTLAETLELTLEHLDALEGDHEAEVVRLLDKKNPDLLDRIDALKATVGALVDCRQGNCGTLDEDDD